MRNVLQTHWTIKTQTHLVCGFPFSGKHGSLGRSDPIALTWWPLAAQLSSLSPGSLFFRMVLAPTFLPLQSDVRVSFLPLFHMFASLSSSVSNWCFSFRLALACLSSFWICIILMCWGLLSVCTYHGLLELHLTPFWTCPLGKATAIQATRSQNCIPGL